MIGNAKNLTDPEEPDTTVLYQYRQHGIINDQVDPLNGTYIPFFAITCANPWSPTRYSIVASDDPYVADLNEHGEVYIGRVPVTSDQEIATFVNKLQIYYSSQEVYNNAFNKELLLNLDVTYPNNGCTAELINVIKNQLVSEHIPTSQTILPLNVSEHNPEPCYEWEICPARANLFRDKINEGFSIINLFATVGGPEYFGGWYDVSCNFDFSNLNISLPFLLASNCHQGEVNNPDLDCTMRKLIVNENGGIIGAIAPTEGSEQHSNGYVSNRFHDLIYQDESIPLGEVFRIIKNELITINKYSWVEFFNNGLTFFGDPSMHSSIYKHKSSNITATSTTWSGNIVVDNTINISAGSTLTISTGTKLFFNTGSSLIVNGTLNATNVLFSSKQSSWSGIYFSAGSTGIIDGCTINNVYTLYNAAAITINGSNPEVKNSNITNNPLGTNGINILNTTNPWIHDNSITNNGGNGIYLNNASAYLYNNQISGHSFNAGVSCNNYSEVTFSLPLTQTNGYNDLTLNKYGLYAYHNCVLNCGSGSWSGYNRIFSNSTANVSANFHSWVYGINNWWGQSPPDLSKFQLSASSLYYVPYLTTDPGGDNLNVSLSTKTNENDNPIDLMLAAKEMRRNRNYSDAFSTYKQILKKNLQTDEAYGALIEIANLFKEYHNLQLPQFVDSLNLHIPPIALKANVLETLSKINAVDSNLTSAIFINNIIAENYSTTDYEKNARVANVLYYLSLNQKQQALVEFETLKGHFPSAEEINILSSILNFEGILNVNKFNKPNLITNEITDYSLENNFPNPFNPTTVIQYQIPVAGLVSLKIYDILGREVKTLVEKKHDAGKYEVNFDGANLASGVYIYQLKAGTFIKSKKMTLIK